MLQKWLSTLIPLPSYSINLLFGWYWLRAMATESSESKTGGSSEPIRDFFGHGPETPDPLWPLGVSSDKAVLQFIGIYTGVKTRLPMLSLFIYQRRA